MAKVDYDRDITPLTRFAEGIYNGLKWAFCYSFTFGIYTSKRISVDYQTSFRYEYFRHIGKASIFFPILTSTTYGMRQLVLFNRDTIISKLHSLHPFFRKNRASVDIILYWLIFLPLGTACNYLSTGRVIRGAFTTTLVIALVMRTLESAFPS